MFPSVTVFGKDFSTYGLCALVGVLVAGIVAVQFAKRRGLDSNNYIISLLIGAAASLLGSHLLYGIVNYKSFIALVTHPELINSFSDFLNGISIVFGGSVFYGGMLFTMLACYISFKKFKMDKNVAMDVLGTVAPLFHGFCRIGCFLGGCCYGIKWAHGFVMHDSLAPDANGVPRFPVQLLEVALNFALFAVLYILLRKGKAKGKITQIYFISYGVIRFCDEFLRGDEYRGFWGPFSTSQWISLFLIIGSVISLLLKSFSKNSKQQEA